MAQGNFMVGATHESRYTCGRSKNNIPLVEHLRHKTINLVKYTDLKWMSPAESNIDTFFATTRLRKDLSGTGGFWKNTFRFLFVFLFVCSFVFILWHINLCRLSNEKSILYKKNSSI